MFIQYNPNPTARMVGDCAVRAVTKALDTDWETAYSKIVVNGYTMGDMPSSNAVWGSVLRQNGYYRDIIPNTCPDCYTALDFCNDNQEGTYVLCFKNHVATVVNGDLYDAWDSSNEIPLYYWYKKEE